MKICFRFSILLALMALTLQPVRAELVAFYDFNDASKPDTAKDVSGKGNDGVVITATYTADGGGHTGKPGDRAMDFGEFNNDAYVDLVTAADGKFDSLSETDQVTVSVWTYGDDGQPYDQWNFYAGPDRQLGSHVPWSNSNIYFDVAGTPDSQCCNDRISTPIDLETFSGAWNHYVYIKDGETSAIYQNGSLIVDGVDMRPMNPITEFFIGVGPEGDRRSYGGMMDDFGVWNNAMTEAEIMDLYKNGPKLGGGGKPGDFDGDGDLDVADINALTGVVISGANTAKYDVTGDAKVDQLDRAKWVNELRKTYFGDADLNGEFNSGDFVTVFGAGQYEDATAKNSDWASGDWNGDGDFDSSDFVEAFSGGGYELGPRASVSAVPEPSALVLFAIGGLACVRRRRA